DGLPRLPAHLPGAALAGGLGDAPPVRGLLRGRRLHRAERGLERGGARARPVEPAVLLQRLEDGPARGAGHHRRPVGRRGLPGVGHLLPAAPAQLHPAPADPLHPAGVRPALPAGGRRRGEPAPGDEVPAPLTPPSRTARRGDHRLRASAPAAARSPAPRAGGITTGQCAPCRQAAITGSIDGYGPLRQCRAPRTSRSAPALARMSTWAGGPSSTRGSTWSAPSSATTRRSDE